MRSQRRWIRVLCAATVLAVVAAACGGSSNESKAPADTTTTRAAAEVPEGGTLVVGAEQEPDCAAWILSCSGSAWGFWMMGVTTLPRVFDVVETDDGGWSVEPNDLVTEEPTVDESDPDRPVVTYAINPDAAWSDGTAISCDDFAFTHDAIVNGADIYDPTGYTDIESVECPDAHTVVARFAQPFGGWRQLFGGLYGVLPAHLLEGRDMAEEMADGYGWSGGPWIIEKWEKGVEIVLVRNDAFWGEKPKFDRIIFRIQADTAAQFQAFKNGEVSMIYPQPQLDAVEQLAQGLPGAKSDVSADTGNVEALWINNDRAPFDDLAVRQAFAHALDRPAIVERLFGAVGVTEPMNTINPPILAAFSETEAFARYTYDLGKVDELMSGAGWEKDSEGYWTKGGQRAAFTFKTTVGNQRRELTGQIVQEQLREAGFEVTLELQEPPMLFGQQLPAGDFEVSLFNAGVAFLAPGQCANFCSKNIPSDENEMSGMNVYRVSIPELDEVLEALDRAMDESEQAELSKQADRIMAEHMVSLPLDPMPNMLVWEESVVGPIGDNPVFGPFIDAHRWGVEA